MPRRKKIDFSTFKAPAPANAFFFPKPPKGAELHITRNADTGAEEAYYTRKGKRIGQAFYSCTMTGFLHKG